ncbi:MAG: hypothetical protein LQ337_008202 [Flavoplaca oasis]|nr:MAG: hypothetical protein LQ337_008202 [Flavoplaca oasis]
MAGKRKRHRPPKVDEGSRKRVCRDANNSTPIATSHPTLSLYYPQILTLRDYLLSKLPPSSKSRRRKIANIKKGFGPRSTVVQSSNLSHEQFSQSSQGGHFDEHASLARLLDRHLVCRRQLVHQPAWQTREQDFQAFSQKNNGADESSLLEGHTSQSEIVDFAIWALFHRIHRQAHRPAHMLCHGYQRRTASKADGEQETLSGIQGITSHFPNSHVGTLKRRPWSDLPNLLGKDGEQIMLDLLLDCAVYADVESGQGNYYQLSGLPLTDLQPMAVSKSINTDARKSSGLEAPHSRNGPSKHERKSPSAITFVRNRMFYARAVLNAKGKVRFGLRHIHVLNRYPDAHNPLHTAHIMKYIFPRQFGLHNVFTSTIDRRETVQPFKDYTMREHEIIQKTRHAIPSNPSRVRSYLPKRLRGSVFDLVSRLQKQHSQCAYYELLRHYCPLKSQFISRIRRSTAADYPPTLATKANKDSQLGPTLNGVHDEGRCPSAQTRTTLLGQKLTPSAKADAEKLPLVEYATPPSDVSALCRAVISRIIPKDFWGQHEDRQHNKEIILDKVDEFICLRRFESLTLHAVIQDLKITPMTWLVPPKVPTGGTTSPSDMHKRKEILFEFIYYLFDSFLVPLVRSNFHVTESNLHKNRIFYFRHDVWRALTEPAMARIKLEMFDEVAPSRARQLLDARTLGFSQIRLLPKGNNVRPITNLRRRVTKLHNGKAVLGQSINSIMAPVHKMLDYERLQNPTVVGSALFSVGDIYPRLKSFKDGLCAANEHMPRLYFAKIDVKSCFDTIPQRRAIKIMEDLASEDVYRMARHAQIKASENEASSNGTYAQPKPARKFLASAHSPLDFRSFDEMVETTLAYEKKNTVFVDSVVRTSHKKPKLLDLLRDHVGKNIVKIGKKFFRQKEGVPQGSVMSSLLCNCFYAKLEEKHLPFVRQDNGLLLRLIDDFLFITTDEKDAIKFLQTMHNGLEEFGVEVNPSKSLANFSIEINKTAIATTATKSAFPYCGTMIDTKTLEIRKDRDRGKATALADALTVERSNIPGQAFQRKAMSAFKIQTHRMFLDTNFNSVGRVMSNIYQNFVEAGMKYYRYAKSLRSDQQPHTSVLIGTIRNLIEMAFVLVKAKHRNPTWQSYNCAVSIKRVQHRAQKKADKISGGVGVARGSFEGCMAEGEKGRAETAEGEAKGGCSVSRIPILKLRLYPNRCNHFMD